MNKRKTLSFHALFLLCSIAFLLFAVLGVAIKQPTCVIVGLPLAFAFFVVSVLEGLALS
jgi:hypothetical protein